MTGDRPTTPGWHCHRCRSTSCRQRADSDTDHVGRVEYRPLLLTQPSSVSWLWSHTHWCPSQRPQEVMRVDGSANPTMPKNPAQYLDELKWKSSHAARTWRRRARPRRFPCRFHASLVSPGLLHEYGTKASKMSQKACLEFVAAPQPARAARSTARVSAALPGTQ